MPQLTSSQDAPGRSAIRRRIERFMVTGGLLGWGVVACVVAGASAESGSLPAAIWFTAAFVVMLFLLGFLIKGYRLEDKHNPNYAPQERAQRESKQQLTAGNTSSAGTE